MSSQQYLSDHLPTARIEIHYFAPLSASEVAPLVDELGEHFFWVRTLREAPGPAASPLLEAAAIAVTLAGGAIAKGFLEELGKDAWRGVRSKLYDLYQKAKSRMYDRLAYHAFALNTSADGVPVTFRIEETGLSEEAFASALDAARVIIAADMIGQQAEPWIRSSKHYFLTWDSEAGTWRSRLRSEEQLRGLLGSLLDPEDPEGGEGAQRGS